MTDTIFAISSGRPPAAIAVMRISGRGARAAGEALMSAMPPPRHAALRTLRDTSGDTLDQALCLWFPGPATATGEDLLELHLHGGRAVIDAVERALARLPGLRPAGPGEFTRRALLAGRIDTAQAHGLADLLAAETDQQRRAALAASDGAISRLVRGWLDRLSDIAAMIEAAIDFEEEDDVQAGDASEIDGALASLTRELLAWRDKPTVEQREQGVRVALIGAPNTGKSSLFNALVERDAAIVSSIAGTTRDVIEITVMRDGALYTFVDTAGIRAAVDPIEQVGVERARHAAASADIVLLLDDAPDCETPLRGERMIRLHPRADLPGRQGTPLDRFAVSIKNPALVEDLWVEIASLARAIFPPDRIVLHRHEAAAIASAAEDLERATDLDDWLLRAELVRYGSNALASIVGVDATEAMLDRLFSRFCIGK